MSDNWQQIRDANRILLMLKVKFGLTDPSFEDCACHSTIENPWLFAARCRSILKNGQPQQFRDFVEPWDES